MQIDGSNSEFFEEEILAATSQISQTWFRTYFFNYLSDLGGLVFSVLGIIGFFIRGYQRFVQQESMIHVLYRTSSRDREQVDPVQDSLLSASSKQNFKDQI